MTKLKKGNNFITLTLDELNQRTISNFFNQPLPHHPGLERAVIGACILDSQAFKRVSPILKPEYFYTPKYQIIFEAMTDMSMRNIPIDLLTVIQCLQRIGKILDPQANQEEQKSINGYKRKSVARSKRLAELEHQENNFPSAYDISDITNEVGSTAHLEAHAYMVYDAYLKRETIITATEMMKKANDPSLDIIDIRNEYAGHLTTFSRSDVLVVESAKERQIKGSMMPVRKSILGSLFREGDITFLFAEAKTGKTTWAYQLANAMAKGESMFPLPYDDNPFENTDETPRRYLLDNNAGPKSVLYYDLEMENDEFFQRTAMNGVDDMYEMSDNLYFAYYNPEYYDYTESFFSKLERNILSAIEKIKPQIIFIDNVTAMTRESLSDSKVAMRLSGFIKSLKIKNSCVESIIILGHCPKRYNKSKPLDQNDLRGSAALGDLTKNLIGIGKSTFDPDLVYIKHIFARNVQREFDEHCVISCRINTEGSMMKYEMQELCEEKELLVELQGSLFGDDEESEDKIILEGYEMYMDNYTYDEIVNKMKSRIHWSKRQWTIRIRKYAEENTSWNGRGMVPRSTATASSINDIRPDDPDFDYPNDWG